MKIRNSKSLVSPFILCEDWVENGEGEGTKNIGEAIIKKFITTDYGYYDENVVFEFFYEGTNYISIVNVDSESRYYGVVQFNGDLVSRYHTDDNELSWQITSKIETILDAYEMFKKIVLEFVNK